MRTPAERPFVRDVSRLADSRLLLPGTGNVRDLVGYPGLGDTVVGPGRLLRGEVLAAPGSTEIQGRYDPASKDRFRALGLNTVIDLRSAGEIASTDSAWGTATGADTRTFEIAEGGEGAQTNYISLLLSGRMSRFTEQDMTHLYLGILDRCADAFAAVVTTLAEPGRVPALVHCTAGKDRTGLAVALVLEILGTPRDVVLDDYALTGLLRPNRVDAYAPRFHERGVDPDVARILFDSPRASMRDALAQLDRDFGGAEGYLVQSGGLAEDAPDRLRTALLVSAP